MSSNIVILDGGMGRELLRSGAPFRQPEWSALALMEAPEYVTRAHDAFIKAGAHVITTNSYAVVPFHIGSERFDKDGLALADRAGGLARRSAERAKKHVQVAGSLPPVLGSYRPDLFDADRASAVLDVLIRGISPHVDIWLAETQSSIREVETSRTLIGEDPRPIWFSFTLEDRGDVSEIAAGRRQPVLRSGETVAAAASRVVELGASALLFNCSQAEIMEAAVKGVRNALEARRSEISIGVYANAFAPKPDPSNAIEANAGLSSLREDLGPRDYLSLARRWVEAGASLIGGCCGIGPEHIAELHETFGNRSAAA